MSAHSSKLAGAFVKAIFYHCVAVRPMMWLAHEDADPRDHVLHANTTLVDRVDLPRYRCPLNRLPASRLLLPRSGLERSDFVPWPDADLCNVSSYVGSSG